MAQHVVGLFEQRDAAERAVDALEAHGYSRDKISVALRDAGEQRDFAKDTGTQSATGAGAGATTGALLGGLGGLLVGIGALAIPGIGPVLAIGPLAGAIGAVGTAVGTTAAGAGVGAAGGGLIGALVGAGVPETEARAYEAGVKRGGVLVGIEVVEGRASEARSILREAGAVDMNQQDRTPGTPGAPATLV